MIKKLVLLLLILVAVVTLAIYSQGFHAPASKRGDEIRFEVTRGQSLMVIAQNLEKQNVIPNAKVFYYYLRLKHSNLTVQAGAYTIPTHNGIIATIAQLKTPLVEGVSVTIPEGWNIWKTAGRLAARFDAIDSSDFVALCSNRSFIESLGLSDVSFLEGYLFPETYSFPKETDSKAAITFMVQHFLDAYRGFEASARAASLSQHEVVTLASIIEEESQVPYEQARISGVFFNRLEQGIPLGADATVRYAIRKFTGPLRVSELKNPSPYNTRLHKGLPPGPIGSPGKGAIEAALNPMKSNEIFFVAKWDGSGEHDFSVTNAEHNRKKMKYRNANKDKQNW